jgi:nitroreductase
MEFAEVLRRRRMTRAFVPDPLDRDAVERIVAAGLRAPSAGNTQGTTLLVLDGRAEVDRFWNAVLPPERRDGFAWPHLPDAPLLIVPCAHEDAYRRRYAEEDKCVTDQTGFWPVPFWHVDTAFAAMCIQLAAIDEGYGVLFFGIFPPQLPAFRATFGVPDDHVPIGAVAIGVPRPDADRPSRSLQRARRAVADAVRRGTWRHD